MCNACKQGNTEKILPFSLYNRLYEFRVVFQVPSFDNRIFGCLTCGLFIHVYTALVLEQIDFAKALYFVQNK